MSDFHLRLPRDRLRGSRTGMQPRRAVSCGGAMYPTKDVSKIRSLAEEAMRHATGEELERRRRRWRDVNGRRKPDRAPVWCGMAGVARELFPPETLECSDPECRRVEDELRRRLYKIGVGDDEIFDPWWSVPAVWKCSTEHAFGLPTHVSMGTTDKGGFRYYHPVETEADYERITVPQYTWDRDASEERLEKMGELLGGVMPVRVSGSPPLTPAHSVYLEQLRGMEAMLGDLAFRPELVHRAMAKITEAVLGAMRAAEASGVLTPNNTGPMTCSDPIGEPPAEGGGPVGLHNLWCAANSQEFQMVSPRMQEEFLLNYQIPCLQQFGAVQYGCCEDLTHKIDSVCRIPNLRIFVCSYWTDLDKLIPACGDRYTIMWRQLSAHVMLPDDLAGVRRDLEAGLRKLRGLSYQVVLREVETLAGHRNRLAEWARIAVDAAERFS